MRDESHRSHESINPETLLAHIHRLPHARATFKQLVRELGARGAGRSHVEAMLDRLVARGDLVELRSGHFVATRFSREYATGKLSVHRDGYGFVIPDYPVEGLRGDIYIPRESTVQAMHGDRVVARILRFESDGRADGEIVSILRRAHPAVVGEFRCQPRGNYVIPTTSAFVNGSPFRTGWSFRLQPLRTIGLGFSPFR